jgi:spore maturation protein CgeB
VEELLGKLTPSEQQRIAAAGRRRVLAEHTYNSRARRVCDLLGAATRRREVAA